MDGRVKPGHDGGRAAMRGFVKKSPDYSRALDRVRGWTRERFGLPAEAVVVVAEVACTVPGCPPLETVIAFWVGEKRHHLKVFKPVADIEPDDLPPSWMKPALAVPEDYECGCC
jgi:hypothetical protein